ncbi:ScbA/BarX family gamma-butyrolactone biosynthesis protein [Streptomyces sp. NPDC050856]|uniref:ScbA/BarX family gamma-butyrolactone biosynthesis protein n=1 Tax=Streptomyces sp. NPDC050856 TaxID=3154939 RepID=UPI0033D4F877
MAVVDPASGIGRGTEPDQPVPMELCHRVRVEDAFAVGWTELGPNRFLVRAVWPTRHPFFAPLPGGLHDPLLVVETMRQSAMAVLHAGYGVPLDHHFLLTDLDYACRPEGLAADGAATEVDVEVTVSEPEYSGRSLTRLRVDWALRRSGRGIATGTGGGRLTSPRVYRRLRGDRAHPVTWHPTAEPADPGRVGRARVEDVVVSPGPREDEWELRADTRHRTLFQRPNDHIPGMLLFEAARQAARAATAPDFAPFRGTIGFHRYAEFDTPCRLRTRFSPLPGPDGPVLGVTGHQEGELVFRCGFPVPGRPPA